MVNKVGVRGGNEPVWAGKPVNWASKCDQEADANELIATESVYSKLFTREVLVAGSVD